MDMSTINPFYKLKFLSQKNENSLLVFSPRNHKIGMTSYILLIVGLCCIGGTPFNTSVNGQDVNPDSHIHTASPSSSINELNSTDKVEASGHFANNQISNGVVTWIQGGFWSFSVFKPQTNIDQSESNTFQSEFVANFTMIKPDGSLSHEHVIDNFKSNNVIFAGNDIVITGIADIHSSNNLEYSEVPITIHLMGKRVLGLMIDVNRTDGHFSSTNELFGTLISGIGLNQSESESEPGGHHLMNSSKE